MEEIEGYAEVREDHIGLLLGIFIYGAMRQQPLPSGRSGGTEPSEGPGGGQAASRNDEKAKLLAYFEAQQAELAPKIKKCIEEQNQALQETAAAAINGEMVNKQPPCAQYMLQWGQQESVAETQIYRLKTGDYHSSFQQINGLPNAPSGGSRPSYYRPSTPSDDGTHAVDNWDRGAIRGTSMYKNENGNEKELPTANYYYHDLETCQYVPSDSSTAPNDGHDYQPMTPEE